MPVSCPISMQTLFILYIMPYSVNLVVVQLHLVLPLPQPSLAELTPPLLPQVMHRLMPQLLLLERLLQLHSLSNPE